MSKRLLFRNKSAYFSVVCACVLVRIYYAVKTQASKEMNCLDQPLIAKKPEEKEEHGFAHYETS